MLPHKTARGAAALKRLKIFEGVPPALQTVKKQVVPSALRYLRLGKNRPFTVLGELAKEFGWKQYDVIKTLEDKRKARSDHYIKRVKSLKLIHRRAEEQAQDQLKKLSVDSILNKFGHNNYDLLVSIDGKRKFAKLRKPRVKKDKSGNVIKAKNHRRRTAKAFKYPLQKALVYKKKKDDARHKKRAEKLAKLKAGPKKNHAQRVKDKRAERRHKSKIVKKASKAYRAKKAETAAKK